MANTIKTEIVLAVGIAEGDGLSLDKILLGSSWRPHGVRNCQEALDFLDSHHVSAVVSEPELPDGTWREFLNGLAELSAPPNLIVSSRLADNLLWAEVLNLGGYDVLMTPFAEEEVLTVIHNAQSDWESKKVAGRARTASAGAS